MNKKYLPIIFLLVILTIPTVFADSHLPIGLLKIQEYNSNLANDFLQNVSFFIAFLAGMLSILSPCILPFLPAYFAITFKEKKKITLVTSIFFLGFTSIFITMGLLATLTGKTLISVFSGIDWLVKIAGLFLIVLGVMVFLGKGFHGLFLKRKFKNDISGIFLTGVAFAIGWTACIGPIISGVLIMASTFGNYLTAAYLMLAYSLGLFVPLFLFSFFYDKIHLDKLTWLNKRVEVNLFGKKINTTNPNILASMLFIAIGSVFVISGGTSIINSFQMFGLKKYFYILQEFLLENAKALNLFGALFFIVFAILLFYFLRKEIMEMKKDE